MFCQKGGSANWFVLLLETCSNRVKCGRCHQAGSLGTLRDQVCYLHCVRAGVTVLVLPCLAVSEALQKI